MASDATSSLTLKDSSDIWDELGSLGRTIVAPLASLRLTVTLFALSVALIFIGTLAQAQPGMNMWRVIEKYFRSYFVMVDVAVLFVPGWFPKLHTQIPAWLKFPFPGGFSIGLAMAVNLLAAHLIRFKVQAKGAKLLYGGILLIIGTAITYLVIASGHNADGLQGRPPFDWPVLWYGIRFFTVGAAVACVIALAMAKNPSFGQRVLLVILTIVSVSLAVVACKYMPDASSLRILWQLIQGGFSGMILLVGCYLVFHRRAGIVLLHAGIGLMMFSEFFVSRYVEEGRMTIREGETVNYVRDIREVELAIIDPTSADEEHVIAVPGRLLRPKRSWNGKEVKKVVKNENLPFDIYVDKYFSNTTLVNLADIEENPANKGSGLKISVKEIAASDGTESEVDVAAAYVEFKQKGSDKSLGKYLLSQLVSAQGITENVEVDGKEYQVSLRFKREYKPYKISLKDVRKDDYVGTNTPMNYSSDVVLTKAGLSDEEESTVGDFHIWMNNPLRYSGETFYQSGYDPGMGKGESTTLQVVSNTGWMMPYIGCMLVSVGMFFHFWGSLWRFLEKSISAQLTSPRESNWVEVAVPLALFLLVGAYTVSKFRPPSDTKSNMKIHEFGKLPVVYQGRVKPMDTLARNALRIISDREFLRAAPYDKASMLGFGDVGVKKPAIQWLLDVISGSPEAQNHRVFKIDNLDVQRLLELPRRKRFRYALSEFEDKIPVLQEKLAEAREMPEEELGVYQKKLFDLERRVMVVRMLERAFWPAPIPPMPTAEEVEADRDAAMKQMSLVLNELRMRQQQLSRMQPPLTIPRGEETEWQAFSAALDSAFLARFLGEDIPESVFTWSEMLGAYEKTNVNSFNDAVFGYQESIAENTPTIKNAKGEFDPLNLSKIKFEHAFNSAQPFASSTALYIIAFILTAAGWAFAGSSKLRMLQRSAFAIILFSFFIHTLALVSRIYISGRPPITNLYSSAVFIGWAAVLVGIVLEVFLKRGVGNALATTSGFITLIIAYFLAADGDTFTVLQAVLDTQFWLATHVVCITLGYSATFVAGVLGIFYVISAPWRQADLSKQLTSATYGILCFAIFFSFVGTVLGGLWADDSWGRFWGWDPKENGALMIVMWNALVLHARWGGLVRQKGIALLAIAGNIITAWSWFGVNELGVGLHSYGFTEGVLRNLAIVVAAHLILIGVGYFVLESRAKAATVA